MAQEISVPIAHAQKPPLFITYQEGLEVYGLSPPLLHTLCLQAAKGLARLYMCLVGAFADH